MNMAMANNPRAMLLRLGHTLRAVAAGRGCVVLVVLARLRRRRDGQREDE